MLEEIEVINHSAVKINKNKIIYVDPFDIEKESHDADMIFITHSHYDHYSEKDISKIKKEDTIFIIPQDLEKKLLHYGIEANNIIVIEPNERKSVNNINFETVPAYNINKIFHLKMKKWVGYIIEIDGTRYYIAGDTDITEENKKVQCDVALVPVGGTYTMNYEEAANLVNIIKPKIAIPIHYGSIVGTKQDAEKFINLLSNDIEGKILL